MKLMQGKQKIDVTSTQAWFTKTIHAQQTTCSTWEHWFKKTISIYTDLRICYIDYSKAFNCVDHKMLWKTLKDMNFHLNIIAILKLHYNNQQTVIRLENTTTKMCSVDKAVRPGCIWSQYLFTVDVTIDVEI